jgi:iron transport multicopper oxidase
MNNVTYVSQKVPSLYTALTVREDAGNPLVYGQVNPFVVQQGQTVEIVLNNLDGAFHPFHLHGHGFQVCDRPEAGTGSFDGDTGNFPLVPMRRDTVFVKPNSYIVLRFKADNPGVHLFHCHTEWHVGMGLSATIIEAPDRIQRTITIPQNHILACNAQCLPTRGNAAGNTVNHTDLTGANIAPPTAPKGSVGMLQERKAQTDQFPVLLLNLSAQAPPLFKAVLVHLPYH